MSILRPSKFDKCDAKVFLMAPPQMSGCFNDGCFQRRMHDAIEEMTASRGTILQAENRVKMQARLAVIASRDITKQTQHLALLCDRYLAVAAIGKVKPADVCLLERADCGNRGGA